MSVLVDGPSMTDVGRSTTGVGVIARPGPDASVVETLYELHGRPLYRFLVRMTLGDRREAEDLVQETIFRAWRYMQQHYLDVEGLRPWLYTVAKRAAIDAGRARKARPTEVVLNDLGTLPEEHDDIERMLVKVAVRRSLMALSPDHRRVLVEVFYNGLTARQAADVLGIPEGTVKSRTFYALRALAAITGRTGWGS